MPDDDSTAPASERLMKPSTLGEAPGGPTAFAGGAPDVNWAMELAMLISSRRRNSFAVSSAKKGLPPAAPTITRSSCGLRWSTCRYSHTMLVISFCRRRFSFTCMTQSSLMTVE